MEYTHLYALLIKYQLQISSEKQLFKPSVFCHNQLKPHGWNFKIFVTCNHWLIFSTSSGPCTICFRGSNQGNLNKVGQFTLFLIHLSWFITFIYIGKSCWQNVRDIANVFACITYLSHTIDLKEYTYIQPGACQCMKFLRNWCFLPDQLIDLKDFLKLCWNLCIHKYNP
jgi:hypothetical protein